MEFKEIFIVKDYCDKLKIPYIFTNWNGGYALVFNNWQRDIVQDRLVPGVKFGFMEVRFKCLYDDIPLSLKKVLRLINKYQNKLREG